MRVGLDIASVFNGDGSLRKYDGIGHYTFNLLAVIKKKAIIVPSYPTALRSLLNSSLKKNPRPQMDLFTSQVHNSVPLDLSPKLSNKKASCPKSFIPLNLSSQLKDKIDLYHSPSQYGIPQLKNKPVIVTVHDAIPFRYPHFHPTLGKWEDSEHYYIKKTIPKANHIITISQAAKLEIMEYFNPPEENITVVYNGISPTWFKKQSCALIEQVLSHYKITKPFFLHVGTLSYRKNIERILHAYLALPNDIQKNYLLVLSGNCGSLFSQEVFQQIKHLEGVGKLIWIPYSTFDELRALYQAATLLLFPSLAEGFGLPILEGFASQIPVLTSKGGATEEIAADAAYLVDPYSVDSLRQGILDLTQDIKLRADFIKKGTDRVTWFSWEKCGQETIAVYSKFC